MPRWNYYKKSLMPVGNLEALVETLDHDDMDIGVVLDIYRASQNGQDVAGDDELWGKYHQIQNQLSKDVNEYISNKRAEIKEAYDTHDYKDIEAFDKLSEFMRELPEDLYEDPEGAIEELRWLIHVDEDTLIDKYDVEEGEYYEQIRKVLEWTSCTNGTCCINDCMYHMGSQIKYIESGTTVSYGRTFRAEKRIKLATVTAGYADGYPRSLSNKGEVIIRGKRCKITGRICMDQFMCDVTDVPDAAVDDEVILIGGEGENRITADDIAAMTGTIGYEVICDISHRVPRIPKQK